MKYETEIKELLISNAINLIAVGGFERATTKELAHSGGNLPEVKMNEAYVYRLFSSKEGLYEAAFARLDGELFMNFRESYEAAMKDPESVTLKDRVFKFLNLAWQFVMKNESRCRCYVRYYYSIYFRGNSSEEHKKLFDIIISKMVPLFKEEADVFSILHSVFISMLDFAIRVYNGDIKNDDINRPHIFNVLYCMMSTYFKNS